MKNLLITLLAIPAMLLTACGNLNTSFDCPMKSGIRCESLDQVNAAVDRGEIGQNLLKVNKVVQSTNRVSQDSTRPLYKDVGYVRSGEPLRYGELVMRVWVAPFEDTTGNYHQESDIFTIVKPSHWIGYPPKQTILSGES